MNILDQLQTFHNVQTFEEQLNDFLLELYNVEHDAGQVLSSKFDISFKELVEQLLRDSGVPLSNSPKTKIEQTLNSVKGSLQDLQTIEITLAFVPSADFVDTLYTWLKREVSHPFVIKLDTNPNLIGGAHISYMGNYGDFSIEKKLEGFNYVGF